MVPVLLAVAMVVLIAGARFEAVLVVSVVALLGTAVRHRLLRRSSARHRRRQAFR